MKNFLQQKGATAIVVVATIILAGIAVFTAVRLYQLRNESVTPNNPEDASAWFCESLSVNQTGPLTATATYEYGANSTESADLDWGDGEVESLPVGRNQSNTSEHTYDNLGTYEIVLRVWNSDRTQSRDCEASITFDEEPTSTPTEPPSSGTPTPTNTSTPTPTGTTPTPTVPVSVEHCESLAFTLQLTGTPTPTPTNTSTPTPTPSDTPSNTPTPTNTTSTPTPTTPEGSTPTPTTPDVGGPSSTATLTPTDVELPPAGVSTPTIIGFLAGGLLLVLSLAFAL